MSDPAWLGSWCAQCGPDVACDEEGCCTLCGADAVGEGADRALRLRAEISTLRAALAQRSYYDVSDDALAALEERYRARIDACLPDSPGFVEDMMTDLHQRGGQVRILRAEVERLKHGPVECPACGEGWNGRETERLKAEIERLREVRGRGCQCGDEEACAFVRERDEARAALAEVMRERDRVAKQRWDGWAAIASLPDDTKWQVYEACRTGPGACWCGIHRAEVMKPTPPAPETGKETR